MTHDTDSAVWTEPNPDQGAINTLYYVSFFGIGLWAVGILLFLFATTRLPAVF